VGCEQEQSVRSLGLRKKVTGKNMLSCLTLTIFWGSFQRSCHTIQDNSVLHRTTPSSCTVIYIYYSQLQESTVLAGF
jgi:hypothetical protein